MHKVYGIYSAIVLMAYIIATTNGYALSSLFSEQRHGGRGSSNVWIHTYHK